MANLWRFRDKKGCEWYIFFIFVLAFLLLVMPGSILGVEESLELKQADGERNLSLVKIYSWSNKLPKDLIDLRQDVEELSGPEGVEKTIADIKKQIEELVWESTSLKSNPNLTGHDLNLFETKLVKLERRVRKLGDVLASNIEILEESYSLWLENEKMLSEIHTFIKSDPTLESVSPLIGGLQEVVDTAKNLIEGSLRSNLKAGHQIGLIQTEIYSLNEVTSELVKEISEMGPQQTSPSMLSKAFYERIDKQEFTNGVQNFKLFFTYQWRYLKENKRTFAFSLCMVILLTIFIRLSKASVKPSFIWYQFASHPLTSALFLFSIGFTFLNTFLFNMNLPPGWSILINLPLLGATAFFVDIVCKTRWQAILLRQLLFYGILVIVFTVIDFPHLLFYLFVFYASGMLLLYYALRFAKNWLTGKKHITWAVVMWGVFPVVILAVGVGGYDQLAIALFGQTLTIIASTLVITVLFNFVCGGLEMFLSLTPWQFVNKNVETMVAEIKPIIALLHLVLWVATILTMLWIFPTIPVALSSMSSLEFSFFSMEITPNSIFTVIFIVYTTVLLSKGIRAFLLQEVLPQHNVEKGVQISITRLVHYAILSAGFLFMLRMLGFGLNQITILGGALGVGVGFGLQAIVNNFVSGLILLFERPIKVGDYIEVEDQVGEVKELGLRATTVQTFDNAEIVIPNSELISGRVTNWTLAEKRVRVRVPVGVAYGTDIEQVLKILLGCGEANPRVLSNPKPSALFLAFGDSSLDFELRAWIPDFDDKLTILSELNQDIESEFQLAGIEIPFPQRDLHLRTVDGDVMETFTAMERQV